MVDTNILIATAVFKSSYLGKLMEYICFYHTLVLSSYVLEELKDVVKRKFPDKLSSINAFLLKLPYEIEFTPNKLPEHEFFKIRDIKDEPVLYSAITASVDILITNDNDFFDIDIERPEIITPSEFIIQ
jgi:putative PIN family toxin of toxin-antitoxin system